jgi:hypothetical protein
VADPWLIPFACLALAHLILLAAFISLKARVRDLESRPGPWLRELEDITRSARTARLERETGIDLADLPPRWRTAVRLLRELRRP